MSGLTVIAALLALTLVPVPAFRTVPLGIGLAVLMVLAATLTLLPAVLSRLGHRINGGRVRMRGGDRPSQRALRGVGRPAVGAAASVRRRGRRDPAAARRPGARAADRDADRRRAAGRCRRTRRAATVQRAFGAGAPSALQVVVREPDAAAARSALAARPGHRRGRARGALARPRAAHRHPRRGGRAGRAERDDRPRPRRAPRRRAGRRPGRRDPRPRARAHVAPSRRRRRGARARLPAARGAAAGADHRGGRRRDEPAGDRRGLRRRPAGVPGRSARPAPGLGVAGLRRRVGADLLLRADLRAGDGLHRVPARHGQGRPRPHGRRPPRARRRVGRHRARDQRGRRR